MRAGSTGGSYEVLERSEYDGGVVQRHVVRGTVDGEPLAADVCIVFHFDGGSITRIYEYLDPASVASVFGAASVDRRALIDRWLSSRSRTVAGRTGRAAAQRPW